jgi:hypothetical protein
MELRAYSAAKALAWWHEAQGRLNRFVWNWFWLPELVHKLEIKSVRSHEHTTKSAPRVACSCFNIDRLFRSAVGFHTDMNGTK